MRPSNLYISIAEVLKDRAQHCPNKLAYTFLSDGRIESERLNYGELDRQAQCVAGLLQSYPRSTRALLLFPPGLEFLSAFFGCAYAGIISIPAPAPDGIRLKRTLPRLRSIGRDATPSVILCSARNFELVKDFCSQVPEFAGTAIISITEYISESDLSNGWRPGKVSSDEIAYLQYTSGATSQPKGVMVTHANLISNLDKASRFWQYSDCSISVNWMPYFHDYGLVEGYLQPLYAGVPSYIMSSFAFIKRPISWLQAISKYSATNSSAPTFAFDYCVHRITHEERAGLDLSSWRVASLGAERIKAETIRDFTRIYEKYGFNEEAFYPSYGLAEYTLLVSSKSPGGVSRILTISGREMDRGAIRRVDRKYEISRSLVSCGVAGVSEKMLIVDPETLTECPPGCIGEVWVAGPSATAGYWNRPEETETTFNAYLADRSQGPFLRTGDLGFIWKEELIITGRLNDLIIVRGANHHPEDIEHTVCASLAELAGQAGAAFAVELAGEERLVVVHEMEARPVSMVEMEKIARIVVKNVAEEHDLRLYALSFVKPGKLPRTSSGKVQRSVCRELWAAGELDGFSNWREPLSEVMEEHLSLDTRTEAPVPIRK